MSLFELGCKFIKLIDTSSLTEEQINSTNRKRADILPIWEFISTNYDNKDFMQIETPLEKIEKISYRYTLEDARKPIKRQIFRLLLHDNSPTLFYFQELLQNAKEDFESRQTMKQVHEEYVETKKPTLADDLKTYSDEGLQNFEKSLSKDMVGVMPNDERYDELLRTYDAVEDELIERGLVKSPF